MYNNHDGDEVPLRELPTPDRDNRLPPDTEKPGKMSGRRRDENGNPKRSARKRINRKRSHNVMDISGTSAKRRGSASEELIKLPKEKIKRIDYVIIYEKKSIDEITNKKDRKEFEKIQRMRDKFIRSLKYDEVDIQEDIIGENVFMKLHVSFRRLCKEAERIRLNMPLQGCQIYEDEHGCCGCWYDFEENNLVTDNEVDFVSAPYQMEKHEVFENHADADKFFRPALRCFLAHHVLINSDLRKVETGEEQENPLAKKGLPYLLHKKVYKDAYIMHDEAKDDPAEREEMAVLRAKHGEDVALEDPDNVDLTGDLLCEDTRQEMMRTWGRCCPQKYQPLWKVRNYFGEKIALYFAWVGAWIETLWIPTAFGFCVFLYGLYLSAKAKIDVPTETNSTDIVGRVTVLVEDSLGVIKQSFDNSITPFYALGICLWGTIFLEVWKRRNATLAYEWDVHSFEDNEPDRPQFQGTKVKPDPIVQGEETLYYPLPRQCMKFFASFSFLIVMVIVVFIAAGSVILYRVFMTIQYCEELGSLYCLLVTTLGSSLLNAVAIMILGKLYEMLAMKLTDWENHRTQTKYDDALIIKLFAFQFANSYTSCFYIAFFRGMNLENGLFGLGAEYQDSCGDGTCMAMLSFQVLILMLVKPIPKLLKDIIIPWLRKKWKTRKCCRKNNKIEEEGKVQMHEYLERERLKPDVGDFTLGEYTEKALVYGFLMLFAASFPLAPLIAILIALIDIRVDARRLLWMYRRPVSAIAQDIGMWYSILQFLNFVGVVTNGFIIAFTSSWGAKYSLVEKLWIVIIFEHIVFTTKWLLNVIVPDVPRVVKLAMRRHIVFFIKFLISGIIPDVPSNIVLAAKREKYQVSRIMEAAQKKQLQKLGQAGGKLLNRRSDRIEEDDAPLTYREDDETNLLPRAHRKKKKKPDARGGHSEEESMEDDLSLVTEMAERPI